jgi:glyoxalase family protein
MNNLLSGIHHVTAIAGDPQQNVDFYAGILGLRMVKKTVNFDDPYTYHLYYGDEVGHPGTLITFFPWSSHAHRGTKGTGQLTVFSFSVPRDAMKFWMDRLERNHISFGDPVLRFGEEVITAMDHDGFQFELVASQEDDRSGWNNDDIPEAYAIRGFHGVTLSETKEAGTPDFLTTMLGFRPVG